MSARKVIRRTVLDIETGRWIEEESFQYEGPWAHAGQPGTFIQDAYAFYDDGTETGAVIIGFQNVAQSLDVDTTFHCRCRVAEDNQAADILETVTWEYNHQSAGYLAITTTSSVLKAVSGLITDGADTTERLTGGTGTFITTNAWATDDATVPDLSYSQQSYCECVLSFQIVGADVNNGEEILIRVDSVTPAIATNTPADIDVVKAAGGRRIFAVT
jgi:hypothetical protein